MSKYTSKPWFAVRYANWFNIQNRDRYEYAANVFDADEVGEEEATANANLAVAAPDLFEACKAVGDRRYKFCGFAESGMPCGNCEACNFTQVASEQLYAAIQKAEGK